jgi:hypothetical protein
VTLAEDSSRMNGLLFSFSCLYFCERYISIRSTTVSKKGLM